MPATADPDSPKVGLFSSNKAALDRLSYLQALTEQEEGKQSEESDLPEALLALLATRPSSQPSTCHEELAALSKLISATAEVVEKGILTESEAESIVTHVLASFVGRRVDKLVDGLFSPSRTRWYLAASQHVYGRIGYSPD